MRAFQFDRFVFALSLAILFLMSLRICSSPPSCQAFSIRSSSSRTLFRTQHTTTTSRGIFTGNRLAVKSNGDEETSDERWNRLLRERIDELEMRAEHEDDGNDDDNERMSLQDPNEDESLSIPFRLGSLQTLALLVSVFFVATIILSNGTIFASSSSITQPKVIWNADEVLRQDFARESSSVQFDVENE